MRSTLIKAATRLGDFLGRRRNRWSTARQDKYVAAWKAAWTEGCDARWRGEPLERTPYRRGVSRDAWAAGWQWAGTQPDRRMRTEPTRSQNRRSSDDTAADEPGGRPAGQLSAFVFHQPLNRQ
jgi:hypothetical protein